MNLVDQTALVMSATRGLGYVVARGLAEAGCRTIITGSKDESLRAAAERLGGDRVSRRRCDIFDRTDVETLLGDIDEHAPDILVVNVPGPKPGGVFEIDEDTWHNHFDSVFLHPVLLMERAAASMMEKGYGRILVVTSVSVKQPIDNLLISNTLRAGITSYAKALAKKVGPHGVTVNTIAPGHTRTDRVTQLVDSKVETSGKTRAEVEAAMTEETPVGRIGEPDEFASAALFLVSPAASYVTGTSLTVDGGRTVTPF